MVRLKCWSSLLLFLVVAAFLSSCERLEKPQWGKLKTRLVYASKEHAAFPSAVRTRDGEILVVFREAPSHAGTHGRIVLTRSKDNGLTWTKPQTVIDTPFDDRDPSIVEFGNGALLINFFASEYDSSGRRIRIVGVHLSRSIDGGHTWSTPRKVEIPGYKWLACSDNVLPLPTGRLILPVYGEPEGDSVRAALALLSDNFGLSWDNWAVIAHDSSGKVSYNEPALEVLPNQEILCVTRTAGANHWLAVSRSTDDGQSWSPVHFTNIQGEAPDVLRTSRGTLVVGYRDFSPAGVSLAFSFDLGRTWERETVLYTGLVDRAYTSLVELPGDQLLAFYYADHTAPDFGVPDARSAILVSQLSVAPPERPTGLSASLKDSNTVLLRWNTQPGVHYYRVYQSASPDSVGSLAACATQNQCVFHPVLSDSVAYFSVEAVRSWNEGLEDTGNVSPRSKPVSLRLRKGKAKQTQPQAQADTASSY